MTVTCAECWRLYQPTAEDVRRHQMLHGHRPCPRDKPAATDELAEAARASERRRPWRG